MGMVILAVSYSKLALYVSYSTSPRETLYLGALRLSQLCFPVGSGLQHMLRIFQEDIFLEFTISLL